ncbi:MAG: glycosyltransferase family 9 protein [Chloroflexota bacterium]|nr:glycosyltransferase family 9 protein [Chloroflexota bacterium]
MNEWLQARNILAVRLDNIGDVVMLGPALRAVKETSPGASITLLGTPGGTTGAALLPWVDDVIVWRPVWQDVGNRMAFDPAREMELIRLLSERNFDAALVFTSFSQTPHPPGYVCYLAGIPLRAGESKEFGGSVLSTQLQPAPDELHQVERNLRLVEHLGFVARHRELVVAVPDDAHAAVPSLLRSAGLDPDAPYVLLHPGASAKARRYPPERFREVARSLSERGMPVLVTGVEREAEIVRQVAGSTPRVGTLVGDTTMPEYAALVETAALVMCGNTLPLHLADALDTPSVILYSGTDYEEQWRPRRTPTRLLRVPTPCHPCYLFECPIGQPCLDIPPEQVVDAALHLVEHADEIRRLPTRPSIRAGANGHLQPSTAEGARL